jgi:hypothetical protein
MWMACYTQEEIAKACGCGVMTINRKVQGFYHFGSQDKMVTIPASDEDDEEASPFALTKAEQALVDHAILTTACPPDRNKSPRTHRNAFAD